MHTTRFALTAAAAIAALTLTACASSGAEGADGQPLTEVTFAVTDQTLSAATASYVTVPDALGYFEEEGLAVNMQPVETALAGVQAVAAGNATCTYASAAAAIPAAASDPSIRIVGSTVGNMFRVVAPASSGLTSVADLEGKTIGTNAATASGVNYAIGGMDAAGVTANREQFLPVGFGAQAALAFQQGQIAAYTAWDSPNLVIESLLGEELVDLDSAMNELNGTSLFVCSQQAVDETPEVIVGIWRAFYKGAVFSETNPEAAIQLHWRDYPSSKPAAEEGVDPMELAVRQLERRLELTGGVGTSGRYGEQNPEDFQHTIDMLTKYDVIEGEAADFDLATLVDYSLIEQINEFDPDAIRAQAETYTVA